MPAGANSRRRGQLSAFRQLKRARRWTALGRDFHSAPFGSGRSGGLIVVAPQECRHHLETSHPGPGRRCCLNDCNAPDTMSSWCGSNRREKLRLVRHLPSRAGVACPSLPAGQVLHKPRGRKPRRTPRWSLGAAAMAIELRRRFDHAARDASSEPRRRLQVTGRARL